MKRITKALRFSVTTLIVLCILFIMGREFLVVNEKPKKTDVIIVLSGDAGRLEKAAALYKEDYAEYVMLSTANAGGLSVQKAIDLGIPENRLILEEKATSTYTNAVYSKSEMKKHYFTSAIIVSSDYHMRRTKLSFERVFKDNDMDLVFVASQRSEEPWYRDKVNIQYTFTEYIRLIGYTFKMYEFIDIE